MYSPNNGMEDASTATMVTNPIHGISSDMDFMSSQMSCLFTSQSLTIPLTYHRPLCPPERDPALQHMAGFQWRQFSKQNRTTAPAHQVVVTLTITR